MGTSQWLEFTGVLAGMLKKVSVESCSFSEFHGNKSKSVPIKCFVKIPQITAETDTFRAWYYNRSLQSISPCYVPSRGPRHEKEFIFNLQKRNKCYRKLNH